MTWKSVEALQKHLFRLLQTSRPLNVAKRLVLLHLSKVDQLGRKKWYKFYLTVLPDTEVASRIVDACLLLFLLMD